METDHKQESETKSNPYHYQVICPNCKKTKRSTSNIRIKDVICSKRCLVQWANKYKRNHKEDAYEIKICTLCQRRQRVLDENIWINVDDLMFCRRKCMVEWTNL